MPELTQRPPYLLTAPGAGYGPYLIVGVVGDKLDDGLSNPIMPECFVPFTAAMGMYTQLLVRTQVPPLTLLHAIRQKVNEVDHDQQTNGDPKIWNTGSATSPSGREDAWWPGCLADSLLWHSHWPQSASTAWSRTPSCSVPTSSAFAWRSAHSAGMCAHRVSFDRG